MQEGCPRQHWHGHQKIVSLDCLRSDKDASKAAAFSILQHIITAFFSSAAEATRESEFLLLVFLKASDQEMLDQYICVPEAHFIPCMFYNNEKM